MADQFLDCKGEKCPKPLILISKAMKAMESGQTVEVEADDPAFKNDIKAWVKKLGHHLLEFKEENVQRAIIKKG